MSGQGASTVEGSAELDFLSGEGELATLMRKADWSGDPLGRPSGWPRSLKTAVRIMLTSRYAMWMGWGPDFRFFYNDAYRPTLGVKHPWAVGKSAREVWAEIWGDIGPRAEAVLRTGVATWDEGLLLFLERSGFPEETYHTFSYSPLPGDDGQVGGMLCVVTEDTERIIGERRLKILRELAADLAGVNVEDEVFGVIARRIGTSRHDLPFALLYLFDEEGSAASLACSVGFEGGGVGPPESIARDSGVNPWAAFEVVEQGAPVMLDDLASRLDPIPKGAWDVPPRQAVVVPIARQGGERPAGFLVAGINPYRSFDASYAGFVNLLAGQVASGLANARAYEQEHRRAEALAEVDRSKTVFFSNVSHEFRTPLTLMLGPIEELLAGPLTPDAREPLEVVHRNALRLQKMVNTLLDFSRIEAGRIRASYEPTDLSALTRDLASVFRSAVEKAGMRLVVDCPTLDQPAFVDRDMWEKIVLNLVSNAFKFTLEGEIEVSTRQEPGRAVLRVRDTGTGIPEGQLPHIFERFHRVEGARARTHEGTGIGLALVRELVRLHGGEVDVESLEGRGTTFSVAIPLGDAHLPGDRVGPASPAVSTALTAGHYVEEALRWIPDVEFGRDAYSDLAEARQTPETSIRPRILLADDNADMRDYVRRLLSTGYEVEAVADGEAALASARARPPDLVLADVMMPRLDGFGLLRGLRGDDRTGSIPVIMLSARAGEEARVEGIEAGVDDYLVKPFGARELLARVGALLEMARVRREAADKERALREEAEVARERASTILESITDGFVSLDSAWKFAYVNAEAERLTGRARDELIGRDVWSTFPEILGTDMEHRYRGAVERQETAEFESFLEAWGRWFEIRAYPSKGGGLSVYFRDITDRKLAEADRERHLIRERQRTEQIQKLAEVSVRLASAHDAASVLGVAASEALALIGAHVSIIGLAPGQDWSKAIHRVSLSERYEARRGDVAPPDGTGMDAIVCRLNRPMRLTKEEMAAAPGWGDAGPGSRARLPLKGWLAAPLVGRDGRNLGLIQLSDKARGDFDEDDEAILVQLAQAASAAVENARLYQELRDNDSRKNEFLAMLAHELRNPLAAISNAVLVSTTAEEDDDVEWGMGVIGRQLKHLSRMIDDLLDVSRISQGKIALKQRVLDLAPILDAALETVRPQVEERRHTLHVEVDRSGLWSDVDPTRMEQVATNLLMNAAKYSEDGGRIWLSARKDRDQVVIEVRDEGAGIPPEKLPEMFELFAQGDRTLARSEGGLGIGLTVVKKLVELHGGSVAARSEGPGFGSEFTVRVPSARPPDARSGQAADAEPTRPQVARILVVDDNVDTARGMVRLLRIGGHDVRAAHNGHDALEAARSFRPEVILLDIGLPGMDGYQVASALRVEEAGRDVAIIALSGYGQDDDRRRSRESGFDHHLVKPVEFEDLLALLARGPGLRAGGLGAGGLRD